MAFGMPFARVFRLAGVAVLFAVVLVSTATWTSKRESSQAQNWVVLENDFSTADRSLDWNLDAPSQSDGTAKSWYAAGTGGGGGSLAEIMKEDQNDNADGDAPQESDASRASWASAGTYDPEGLQQGGEAAQLKELKETLEAHGAY